MQFNREIERDGILPEYVPMGSVEAQQILEQEVRKKEYAKIVVYYDPDIDGINAGLMMQQYLGQSGVVSWHKLNENRKHGFYLSDSEIEQMRGGLIIAVDFSINKEDMCRVLSAGINLIVLDHHEIQEREYEGQQIVYLDINGYRGIVLNNQYAVENEKFRFLSGAGMVYYFIKHLSRTSEIMSKYLYSDYAGMMGITLLSDVREIETNEAREILEYTFTLNSEYMKYLIWLVSGTQGSSHRFSAFGQPCISRNFIDFTFSPIINALLRFNKGEEVIRLLKGDDITILDMRDNDKILQYRQKQKQIVSNIMTYIKDERVDNKTWVYENLVVSVLPSNLEILANEKEQPDITNFIGVACSKIKDDNKTGVILVVDPTTNKLLRGSLRGALDGVDYLEIFRRHGIQAAGHLNAFGILECDTNVVNFEEISKEMQSKELDILSRGAITKHLIPVPNLSLFMRTPQAKFLCKINEYSRDTHRVYLQYVGSKDTVEQIVKSPKYTEFRVDGFRIDSFDSFLNLDNSVISIGLENGKYINATLRPNFAYTRFMNNEDVINIQEKMFKYRR